MKTTRKKLLSLMLASSMTVGLMSGFALTAQANGTSPTFSGGRGTSENPWKIATAADLKELATAVNDGNDYYGEYFRQVADLDMNAETNIAPIGTLSAHFAGNYDAYGFEISNVSISGVTTGEYTVSGLFGVITGKGSISNLTVNNATISAISGNGTWDQAYAGGIAAFAEDGTVTNCTVRNSTITTAASTSSNTFAGGIVGFAASDNGETTLFTKCASENNSVSSTGYGGGFIGAVISDGDVSFEDVYSAKNSVNAGTKSQAEIGAFLGASQGGDITVKNCFIYDCNVSAANSSGGKVGLFTADEYYGKVNASNSYYYDKNNLAVNAEQAVAKNEQEMKSLAATLGDAFEQGTAYPILKTPVMDAFAEYTQVGDYTGKDDVASAWTVTVTPGTYTIESLDVKVNGQGSDDGAWNGMNITSGTVTFAVAVNLAAVDVSSVTAVVNGSDVTTTFE